MNRSNGSINIDNTKTNNNTNNININKENKENTGTIIQNKMTNNNTNIYTNHNNTQFLNNSKPIIHKRVQSHQ